MKPFTSHLHSNRGFALPMTIIAIGGLTLLLVGLITVLTIERKTARSYSDATRADLAVESGLATALAAITQVAGHDDSLVFRLEDPVEPTLSTSERPLGFREQFFTYGAVFENDAWQAIPLFSGSPATTLGNREIDAQILTTQLQTYVADAKQIGSLTEHDQNIPRAQWVEIPADSSEGGDYTLRYSYWIEDLGGRIDGKRVGSEPQDRRLSTAELDISTIFDPTAATGKVPPGLSAKQQQLRTPASVRTVLSEDEAKRIEPYIHFHVPVSPTPAPKVIPQGFGYADAGTPAPDLNKFVQDADVEGIAEHIEENLPLFRNRKGGFPASEDYLKTIAASVIDYADADNNATIGTGYRGVDSYPFVNELFDRYEWTGGTANSIEVTVESYVELWNPSDKETTGVMFFINENRHEINVPPNDYAFTDSPRYIKPGIRIPPNGFEVIFLGSTKYNFPIKPSFQPTQLSFPDTEASNFKFWWNGRLVDTARGGLMRQNSFMRFGNSQRDWKGNASMALDYRIDQDGDPRASYYIAAPVFFNNYRNNSNWGGRSLKRAISNSAYNEVRLEEWEDKGTNSTPGTQAGSDATRPTQVAYPANQPDLAPASISNSGRYDSLAELGNIFDPAQYERVDGSTNDSSPSLRPSPNPASGGGFTLAIGRPEFRAFDSDGIRSAQLLDLFSIEPEISASVGAASPVNINTASREVLRALVAGATLDGDPATPGVVPPHDTEMGDIFADYLIAQRSRSPLRGPSDMNTLRLDPADKTKTTFFGSRDAYKDGTAPPDTWDDAGREELFRKTLNLISFTSKIFRVVVSGEALDKQGEPIGRSTREFHYSVEPVRDPATGEIVTGAGGNPSLTITKLYENSI